MTNKNVELVKPRLWFIYFLFLITSITSSAFAIYEIFLLSSIENLARYIVIGVMILIDLILIKKFRRLLKPKKKKKKRNRIIYLLFMIFYSIICAAIGLVINYIYGEISSLNKVYVTYTSNLIVMTESGIENVSSFNNYKIGILEDDSSIDGHKIPMDMVKENKLEDENELVEYGDYTSMIVDLYSGDINACFVSDGYVTLFSNIAGYEKIAKDTKIILTKSKKMKKSAASRKETASSGKEITEPFTILLMGIDSTAENLEKGAVANGDTLILITFNPKTLNATMLSIPRDSYVPIACWSGKTENKITHAAAYGNDCMISTIEEYFDANIDYYAKINFKGLVKLVDAVGGVEIDVEQELCTDNSDREHEVCIKPGLQTLNGEEALVYARNRKQLANGDFGRNYHQQVIIMALMNKVKEIDDVTTFMNILNTVSNSVDTNFTTKQILSFYNVAKDIIRKSLSSDEADIVNIDRLYLQGTSQMIYDERAKMVLYNYVPNTYSKKDIIQAMKENLEQVPHTTIKSFSFSINEPFEKTVIGYGPYKNTGGYTLLPDFTGDSKEQASATCSKLGITCTFKGAAGTVVSQNYPASSRVDKIKTLELTLSQQEKAPEKEKVPEKEKEKDKESDKEKEPEEKPKNPEPEPEEPKDDSASDDPDE